MHKAHQGGPVPVHTKAAPCQVDLPSTCIAGLTVCLRLSGESGTGGGVLPRHLFSPHCRVASITPGMTRPRKQLALHDEFYAHMQAKRPMALRTLFVQARHASNVADYVYAIRKAFRTFANAALPANAMDGLRWVSAILPPLSKSTTARFGAIILDT